MQREKVHNGWAALTVGAVIFLACSFLIINQLAAETDQPKPQPDIKFKEKVYDFGTIEKGEKAVHIFRFKNEGQALLKIGKVKTSCGCTVSKAYTKEVLPGEEGQIEVIFNSTNFFGSIHKTIYVNSNDPDEPVVNLSLKGRVVAEVAILPPRELYFGLVHKGRSSTKYILIKQGGTQELKILKVEVDLPFITTKVIPEPGNDRKKNYKLEVTVAPDAPEGGFKGTIKIHTNIKKYSMIKHKISGVVRATPPKARARKPQPPSH
jgi:hypothetical protein